MTIIMSHNIIHLIGSFKNRLLRYYTFINESLTSSLKTDLSRNESSDCLFELDTELFSQLNLPKKKGFKQGSYLFLLLAWRPIINSV